MSDDIVFVASGAVYKWQSTLTVIARFLVCIRPLTSTFQLPWLKSQPDMKPLVILSLVASVAVADRVSYDGFKVFRLTPTPNLDVPALEAVLQAIEYDQWNKDTNDLTIAVAPDQVPGFLSLGLEATVMHEDLGQSIAEEGRSRGPAWNLRRQVDDLSWYQSYHAYDEHREYFEQLHAAYPNNTELVSTGTSYEGRDLFGLHIWGADGPGKPAVLWHGTVHAREWISAPVVEYLTLQLLSGYGQDAEVTALVDRYDYWIFPFVNPDGEFPETCDSLVPTPHPY
jgi:zinc carboxypeptidase